MLETFEVIGETTGNHWIACRRHLRSYHHRSGLIIAVTDFGLYLVRRRRNRFREFLYHLENLTLQHCQQS